MYEERNLPLNAVRASFNRSVTMPSLHVNDVGPRWPSGYLARLPPRRTGFNPGRVTRFSQVGIVPDDAVGRGGFLGISRPPPPRSIFTSIALIETSLPPKSLHSFANLEICRCSDHGHRTSVTIATPVDGTVRVVCVETVYQPRVCARRIGHLCTRSSGPLLDAPACSRFDNSRDQSGKILSSRAGVTSSENDSKKKKRTGWCFGRVKRCCCFATLVRFPTPSTASHLVVKIAANKLVYNREVTSQRTGYHVTSESTRTLTTVARHASVARITLQCRESFRPYRTYVFCSGEVRRPGHAAASNAISVTAKPGAYVSGKGGVYSLLAKPALDMRVSVALIAPSLLDLGRAAPTNSQGMELYIFSVGINFIVLSGAAEIHAR
ncbi:hypothetical protein PR048_029502 [Dryococelus australis]|uniref:Uncharacterized protein n=1 Tax=Dryococelus australis TaxID=614101 RepID=A0ABQ9GDI9_9NEOP|nr:hypothetical protein PR048_029502 [Dryococelus australis]